jgi:hypothetical protein
MMARLAGALMLTLPSTAIAQIAILQIRAIEGEGAVHAAGSRGARPLVVQVTDEVGRPVQGAAVTFHLPDEGPSATFATGIRTDMVVTDALGRAAVRGMQYNRTPGRFEMRILAAKGSARAGTVSFQYISDARAGGASAQGWLRRKWLTVALIAAGAVGGGVAAGAMGSAEPKAVVSTPGLTIGSPVITVGKP